MVELNYLESQILLLISLIYASVLIMIGFKKEVKLRTRSKINYNRFMKYEKSYDLSISYRYLIFSLVFIVFTTLVSLIFIDDPTFKIYTIIIVLLTIFNFSLLILHITSIKYNKDLSTYSNYYTLIKESFDNREQLENQIKDFDSTYKLLLNQNDSISQDFSKFFDNNGIGFLNNVLHPLKDVLILYRKQLKNFNFKIIREFERSLAIYLHTGKMKTLLIQKIKIIGTVEFNKILESITDERNKCIYEFSLTNLKEKRIVSSQLLNMVNKLESLNISLSDEIVIEILKFTNNLDNKYQIMDLLATKNLISIELLSNHVHAHDWAWVYDMSLSRFIDTQNALHVFTSIISYNATNCAYKVLTSLEKQFIPSLKQSVIDVETDNETRQMFVAYSNILSNDTFVNQSTKFENMAIVLYRYYEDYYTKDSEAIKIKEIIKNQTFLEYGRYIESIYDKVKENYKDLFLSIVNTLFIYNANSNKKVDYINNNLVLNQYLEYRKNLNINEIKILDILLKTLILFNEDDSNMIRKIYPTFDQNIGSIVKDSSDFEQRKYVGKTNIKYLTNANNVKTFKRVINQIENGRLVFDKIVNL